MKFMNLKDTPYIIGETAFHHQGEMEYLKDLIDEAAALNLSAIKFHLLFDLEDYFVAHHPAFDTLEQWLFSEKEWSEVFHYSRQKNLDIVALCNDVSSLRWINEKCDVPVRAVEVHATGINDVFLLNEAASFENTVILGVGGSNLEQIQFAVTALREQNKRDIFLMYGFQNYPTDYKNINLNKIQVIKDIFNLPVGYADHTAPSDPNNEFVTSAAILKGVSVIEKHFTLDVNDKRIDSQAAVSLSQMKKIKELCSIMYQSNGPGGIEMSGAEKKYGDTGPMKKAIVARKNIPANKVLELDDLAFKRTPESSFLDQKDIELLIGMKTNIKIDKDEIIDYRKVEYRFDLAETNQFFNNK